MSVTFEGDTDEAWGDGPAAYEPGDSPRSPGDRTPPQDNAAEQSVLGSMLLSKDAIADVVDVIKGVDYYRPAHEVIHDAIIDLYGRGEPADPITVAAELGLPPADCLVIEDAVSGVQAARAGGMDCVGIARLDDAEQLRAAGATLVVTSLDDVAL